MPIIVSPTITTKENLLGFFFVGGKSDEYVARFIIRGKVEM